MAWEENSRICLHMQLIAILSRTGVCMLILAIGESVKGIDKMTNKQLLVNYPEVDWKGVMGIRDIIAHHYFDLDESIVFDVVKNRLPGLLATINKIIDDL